MKSLLISLFCFLAPLSLFAHNNLTSFETTSGIYFIDIGYSDAFTDQLIRFDFAIYEDKTKRGVPFESVWVNISKETEIVYAGPIAYGEFGKPGMSLVISNEGEYTVSARFETDGKTIAETSFPITITNSEDKQVIPGKLYMIGIGLGGIILGFSLGKIGKRK